MTEKKQPHKLVQYREEEKYIEETSAQRGKPPGILQRMLNRIGESPRGIRKQSEIMQAHADLFSNLGRATEALIEAEMTPERLRNKYELAGIQHKTTILEEELKQAQLEAQLKLIDRRTEAETAAIEAEIRESNQKAVPPTPVPPSPTTRKANPDEIRDPEMRHLDAEIKRIMDSLKVKKTLDAALSCVDEMVAKGEYDQEEGEALKQELKRQYERARLKL